jgi:hypothetical protein
MSIIGPPPPLILAGEFSSEKYVDELFAKPVMVTVPVSSSTEVVWIAENVFSGPS